MKKYALIFVLAIFVTACVEKQKVSTNVDYATTYIGLNNENTLILVPIETKQNELESESGVVMQNIEQHLRSKGWKIHTLKKEKYTQLWNKIINQLGGIYSSTTGKLDSLKYQSAIAELIKSVNLSGNASGVIVPSLVLRQAKLKGGSTAFWDGSSRKMIKNGKPTKYSKMSGTTKGLSLRILVFNEKGHWAFTSFGGLVLPYESIVSGSRAVIKLRKNIFKNEEHVKAGVKIALSPIF